MKPLNKFLVLFSCTLMSDDRHNNDVYPRRSDAKEFDSAEETQEFIDTADFLQDYEKE